MIAYDLIKDTVPSVKSTDTVGHALDWMAEFKLTMLPIVEEAKYSGLITENDILEASDINTPLSEIKFSGWENAYAFHDHHLFDVIKVMSQLKLELLPVIHAEDNSYLGVVTLRGLTDYLGRAFAVHEPGAVIVLQVSQNSYMLSEIGRIVESADAKVLGLYVSDAIHQGYIYITLKVNVEDPSRIITTFERFEYNIVMKYLNRDDADDLQRNLDALLRYLDI